MAEFEDRASRPLVLVCGTLATKNTRAFLRAFSGLAREVLAVPVKGDSQGRMPEEVAEAARDNRIVADAFASVTEALEDIAARDWPVAPRILIAGSLHLAGEVLAMDGSWPE
jgi:dihydrofolate synthase/folylpolyglutamate synthase